MYYSRDLLAHLYPRYIPVQVSYLPPPPRCHQDPETTYIPTSVAEECGMPIAGEGVIGILDGE